MSFRLINDANIDTLTVTNISPSSSLLLADINPNPVFGQGSGLEVILSKIGSLVNITWKQIPATTVTNVGIPSFSGIPLAYIPLDAKVVPIVVTNNGTNVLGRMVIIGGGDPGLVINTDLSAGTFSGVAGVSPGSFSYDIRI